MARRVADLTIEELERVVEQTVRRTIEEYLEDLEALASRKYLDSIRESREEYERGEVKPLSDLADE